MGPGDSGGNFDEAIFAYCNHLCHATLHAVSDGLGLWAKTFQALGARLAPTAGVGEEGDDGVSRAEGGDAAANLGHDAGDLVAGDEGCSDAAAEGSVHYQQVVVAEAASGYLNEGVEVAEGGWGRSATVSRRVRGRPVLQDEGFHGAVIRRGNNRHISWVRAGLKPAPTGDGGIRRIRATTRVAPTGEGMDSGPVFTRAGASREKRREGGVPASARTREGKGTGGSRTAPTGTGGLKEGWVPAFAGTTEGGAGITGGCGDDV